MRWGTAFLLWMSYTFTRFVRRILPMSTCVYKRGDWSVYRIFDLGGVTDGRALLYYFICANKSICRWLELACIRCKMKLVSRIGFGLTKLLDCKILENLFILQIFLLNFTLNYPSLSQTSILQNANSTIYIKEGYVIEEHLGKTKQHDKLHKQQSPRSI